MAATHYVVVFPLPVVWTIQENAQAVVVELSLTSCHNRSEGLGSIPCRPVARLGLPPVCIVPGVRETVISVTNLSLIPLKPTPNAQKYFLYWEVAGGHFARDWCMIFLRPLIFRGFVLPIVAVFGL
jgi:hypothetical protein